MTRHVPETKPDEVPCPAPDTRPNARPSRDTLWDYIKAATGIIAALGTLAAAVAQIIGALRR